MDQKYFDQMVQLYKFQGFYSSSVRNITLKPFLEFCTEMLHLRKKKDKISLHRKLLTKMMRDASNSNSDN